MIAEGKSKLLSRRNMIIGGASAAALALSGCARSERVAARFKRRRPTFGKSSEDYTLIYGPKRNEQFPLPAVDLKKVKSKFYRREVANRTGYPAGTVVVDTKNFYLYWTQPDGTAMRYGGWLVTGERRTAGGRGARRMCSAMASRSYSLPSAAMTGSRGRDRVRGQTNSSATPCIWVLRRLTGDESSPAEEDRLLRRLALGVPDGDGCGEDVVLPRAAAGEEEAELLSE